MKQEQTMQVKITGIGGVVMHYPESHDFYETRQQFAASIKLKNPPELNDWTIEFQILGNIVNQNKKDTRQRAADSTHVRQGRLTPYIFYLGSL